MSKKPQPPEKVNILPELDPDLRAAISSDVVQDLVQALQALLPCVGWTDLTDEQLKIMEGENQGGGSARRHGASIVLRARAALRAYTVTRPEKST